MTQNFLFDILTAEQIFKSGDLSKYEVMLPLSAGINSAAVLCTLADWESDKKPKVLHIFYAHLEEHSPDSFQFVADQIRYARLKFPSVKVKITRASALRYFEGTNMIPHPQRSPCTYYLKTLPMHTYMVENKIQVDLVGYVREEKKKRYERMKAKASSEFNFKAFPVLHLSDDDCFELVKMHIGWYPAIYDIKDETGKRVFKHNNCLPCKNMHYYQLEQVKVHYPEYHNRAMRTAAKLQAYWGRDKDEFYTRFGRDEAFNGGKDQPCEVCAFD
jgi:3'-phosphoadenosine 5'-phosphosulfate sulfotransferase (PAPS reductase)/FAD synthetase